VQLVRQEQLDGGPVVIGELVAHDSRPKLESRSGLGHQPATAGHGASNALKLLPVSGHKWGNRPAVIVEVSHRPCARNQQRWNVVHLMLELFPATPRPLAVGPGRLAEGARFCAEEQFLCGGTVGHRGLAARSRARTLRSSISGRRNIS
jgi:hypothetical protein